ncbi:vWA domain-containing protein [Nocardia sp. NPDC004340]
MSNTTGRLRQWAAAAAIGFLALTGATMPAAAEETPDYAPTMLILDASGSMERPDPAGTMMDAAKVAVHSFVDSAPAQSRVGLAVYGTGTGNTEADKAAGCQDVQVLHKPQTLDRAALGSAVDGVRARGWTPMGTALRQAAAALPDSGPRSIVLVSDGDDTCSPPDPCEVAAELKQRGLDLVLHTIGFAVDGKARAQLTCMAQATGGTYTDAADGAALQRTLPRVTASALRNYKAVGTPITGTGSHDTAPVATPGLYLDTIGQKEKRYWGIDIPDGATAYFSGTVSFPRVTNVGVVEDMNVIRMRAFGADGKDCNLFEFQQTTSSSDGVAMTVAKSFERATQKRENPSDTCKGGGKYYFQLEWDRVATGVPERLPIELIFAIEPGVTDPGPAAAAKPTTFVEQSGPGTPVSGGASFTVAADLPGAGRYTDVVRPGEFVFYRVHLDWGQALSYRVNYAGNGVRGSDNISNIHTAFYNPIREEIDSDTGAYTGSDTVLPSSKALATTPVRYTNRSADRYESHEEALAGWYYISVKVGSNHTTMGSNTPVPVQVDLTVSGTEESGPRYTSTADIFGEHSGPSVSRTSPSGKTPGAPVAADSTESKSNSTLILIAAAVGATVVVLGGVLIAVLVARGRRSR